jgi:hypothetical protein
MSESVRERVERRRTWAHVKLPHVTTGDDRSAELHATMRDESLRTPLRFTDRTLPTIEHPLFGRMWAPQMMVDLTALLALFGWQLRGGWRGQTDIDWHLDSTAVRRIGEPRPEDDLVGAPATYLEKLVREYEQTLLDRARMSGHGRAHGRDLYDLELLALLRHHGAATRLMDFTHNVWVALWFACRAAPDRFGMVVGLDLRSAFEVTNAATLARPFPELLDHAGERLSLWRSSALSPRIPAQQGFFLWGPARFRRWGSIGQDLVGISEQMALVDVDPQTSRAVPGLVCIAVPPELKHDLSLHWSSLFGYAQETMFPDLDGFAQANAVSAPLTYIADDEADERDEPLPSDEDAD